MPPDLDEWFREVQRARERLDGVAHKTPVVTSVNLDALAGARVFLKCENLQRTGAFKFRGAYNTISQLSDSERERGVLAYSSGNHAQAVAKVGSLLGVAATIVMPVDAPAAKRKATERYGARVVEYDPVATTREELGERMVEQAGYTLVRPYDDPRIVAGQGTAALELHNEVNDLDYLVTPCGGGGLLSGSAIATRGLGRKCKIVGVEPQSADDATRSFKTGELHSVLNPDTIADGTRTPSLGVVTFPLVREYVDDMVTVSENAIKQAVRVLAQRTKLLVEPSGALGIAALLESKLPAGSRVGVILSGGNVDMETLKVCLEEDGKWEVGGGKG